MSTRKTSLFLDDSNSLQPLTLLSSPQGIPTSFNSTFFHKLSKIMRIFFSWSHSNLSRKPWALPRVVSTFISFVPKAFSFLTCLSTSSKSLDLPTPPGPYSPTTLILSSVIALIMSSVIEALDSRTSSFLSNDLALEVVAVTIPIGGFS
ncbi:hypothetical protein BT93_E0742 [Corymbia citriodora subsp. variegata]|nr:hypothetical protein BT93_E0742 [Corymbia citriodora subsp. variegata]